MGDLTRKVQESTCHFYERDQSAYDRLYSKISPKTMERIIWILCILINISALVIFCRACWFWSEGVKDFQFINQDTGKLKPIFSAASVFNNAMTVVTLVVLCVFFTFFYFHMRHVVNKFFSGRLSRMARNINMLFGVILTMYWLRTIWSTFQYFVTHELVCQFFARIMVNSFTRYFYIYTVILSMLYYQHKIFSHQLTLTTDSPDCR